MEPENVIAQLIQQTPAIFNKFPVLFAYLYGSYAGKTVHPFSDIDIAIFTDDVPEEDLLDLELKISVQLDAALKVGDKFDVRTINHMPLLIKGKILTEGQLIYSTDEVKRVEFEVITRKLYFDFLPVIYRYYDEYLKTTAKGEKWF